MCEPKQQLFVIICKTKLNKNCAIISIDDATTLCIFIGINTNENKINFSLLIKELTKDHEQWQLNKYGFGTIDNLKIQSEV